VGRTQMKLVAWKLFHVINLSHTVSCCSTQDKFEVPTAVEVMRVVILVFWIVMPCRFICRQVRSKGPASRAAARAANM
jgi:ribose/xylose/arabinose/galactoside ABC-type transport system permease subunit